MTRWTTGERTVNYLIERGKLEELGDADLESAAATALDRASKRLRTAAAGLDAGDIDGAYSAAYDAYRMAAESLLVRQGLRGTGGEGSHVTVEDAVSAQFADLVPAFGKATFERMRRTRHAAQYFDPSSPPIDHADAEWALDTSRLAVAGTTEVMASTPLDRFVE